MKKTLAVGMCFIASLIIICIICLLTVFSKDKDIEVATTESVHIPQINDYDSAPDVLFIYYVDNIVLNPDEYGERYEYGYYISVLKKNGDIYLINKKDEHIKLDTILEYCETDSPLLVYKSKVDNNELKEKYNEFVDAYNKNKIKMESEEYSLGVERYYVEIIGVGQNQDGIVYKDTYDDYYINESEPVKDVNEWLIKAFDAPYQ